MHLIVTANHLSSRRGGLERSLFDVCRELHQRGHTLTVLYEDSGDQLNDYQQFCQDLILIDSYRLSTKRVLGSLKRLVNDIARVPTQPDSLVYNCQYDNNFFAACLATAKGLPLINHLRNPVPKHLRPGTSSRITLIKESLALARNTKFIAVSGHAKQAWAQELNLPSTKIEVVYNGIDPAQFAPPEDITALRKEWGLAPDQKIITYVGRLDGHKGIESLVRAFKPVRDQRADATLLLAGKVLLHGGDFRTELKDLVVTLGLKDHVRFLGHVSNPAPLFQLSDLSVTPSLWPEPFGRTIIEAMACGTPVVASRTGGIPEVMTEAFEDFLFPPGDVDSLAGLLMEHLDWREQAPTLGDRCRQQVLNQFQLYHSIDGIEKVLLSTLKTKP